MEDNWWIELTNTIREARKADEVEFNKYMDALECNIKKQPYENREIELQIELLTRKMDIKQKKFLLSLRNSFKEEEKDENS